MIIDCFPFFNELDLLELRLNELSSVVDVFFLSESPLTFSGKPKPLFFKENMERFEKFLPQMEHFVVDDFSSAELCDAVAMDRSQKQQGMDAMKAILNPSKGDYVILTDLDEIPKAEKIIESSKSKWDVAALEMPLFYYRMDCVCTDKKWYRGKIIRPNGEMRFKKIRYGRPDVVIKDAGWHFSWLVGDLDEWVKAIQYKMDSWTHTELNVPPFNTEEHIRECVANCTDLFDRKHQYKILDDLTYLPKYVTENLCQFGKYICPF